MTIKHVLITLLALLIPAFLGIGLIIYWMIIPVPTFEVKNFSYTDPIHVETPVLHPGDVLRYLLDYCKYTDIIPTSKTYLVDGFQLPISSANSGSNGLLVGCHKIEREVIIPETANPGRYYYDKELSYKVNPIRTIKVYYYTEYFQVVDRETPSTSAPPLGRSTLQAPANPLVTNTP